MRGPVTFGDGDKPAGITKGHVPHQQIRIGGTVLVKQDSLQPIGTIGIRIVLWSIEKERRSGIGFPFRLRTDTARPKKKCQLSANKIRYNAFLSQTMRSHRCE